MTDLSEATYILGIHLDRNFAERTIWIHQSGYIKNILERFRMQDCKPVTTPLDPSIKLIKNQDLPLSKIKNIPYQSTVGSLIYAITNIRLDIVAAVGVVYRFISNSTK